MKKGTCLIAAGIVVMGLGIGLMVYNGAQSHRAGLVSAQTAAVLEETVRQTPPAEPEEQAAESQILPDYVPEQEPEMPTRQIDGTIYLGLLEIPKLNLLLPVIDQCTEGNLKLAPCRYAGAVYQPDFVICAHNYTAHFGSLGSLGLEDAVLFTDLDGNVFSYTVASVEVLAPTDVEAMTQSGWDLTLFTCTVGGQNRLAVRCQLVS